jgi:hypothetical protein
MSAATRNTRSAARPGAEVVVPGCESNGSRCRSLRPAIIGHLDWCRLQKPGTSTGEERIVHELIEARATWATGAVSVTTET